MDDSYVKRGNSPETCEQLAAEFAGAVEPSFRRMGWHGMFGTVIGIREFLCAPLGLDDLIRREKIGG
ncbi:hypothetical protein V6N13_125925 [Hibiscus sabdariffa]